MCTNTSVRVFQINFCQPATWLIEVCCIIDSNILVLFQIYVWIVGGRLQSIIMRTLSESFFGTAPSALIIVGMWEWSASAKWSCWRPLNSCTSIWSLDPGRKADLLFCVKACTTMESAGSWWKACWNTTKINSMSGSCGSSVAQVSNTAVWVIRWILNACLHWK